MTPLSFASTQQWCFDGQLFDTATNITYAQSKPRKLGPVLGPASGHESVRIGPYGSVRTETIDGLPYQMWYSSNPWTADPWRQQALAQSSDGLNWSRPTLNLVTFRGKTTNNLTEAPRDGSVYVDTAAIAAERYKFIPNRFYGGAWYGTRICWSADGKSWTENSTNNLTATCDSCNLIYYDSASGNYVMYMRGWTNATPSVRTVVRLTVAAADIKNAWSGTTWAKTSFGNVLDGDVNTALKITASSAYEVYNVGLRRITAGVGGGIMMASIYDRTNEVTNIHLASSRDGITWAWADGDGITSPFIPRGATSDEDCGTIYPFTGSLTHSGFTYVYYGGSRYKHDGTPLVTGHINRSAIFGASFKQDRFIGAVATGTEGNILTEQFTFTGSGLSVNVDAEGGEWKAALCDSSGNAYTGFNFADCTPITTDGIAHSVVWTGGSIASKAGTTVTLRVKMRSAKWYTFTFS